MAVKVEYVVKEAGTSLKRQPLMVAAAILTVWISLSLLGGTLTLNALARKLTTFWSGKVEVSVFLKDEATPEQQKAIEERLLSLPEVDTVVFESKEEAWNRFKEMFKDTPDIVENVGPEALPASYRVKLKDPNKFEVVREALRGYPGVEEVRDEREVVRPLLTAVRWVNVLGMSVVVIFLLAAALLVANTIRLAIFARRQEIAVMRLVGASNWYIRLPFVLEGLVEGVAGALLAVLVNLAVTLLLHRARLGFYSFALPSGVFLQNVAILLATGAGVGAVASAVAIRRFLRV
jgi:cell division transport system permease protein